MCKYELKLELDLTPKALEYVKNLESNEELASTISYLLGRYGEGDIIFSTKSLLEMINKVLDNYDEDGIEEEENSNDFRDLTTKVDELKELLLSSLSNGVTLTAKAVESPVKEKVEEESVSDEWDFDDLDNVAVDMDDNSNDDDEIDLSKLGEINKKLYGG